MVLLVANCDRLLVNLHQDSHLFNSVSELGMNELSFPFVWAIFAAGWFLLTLLLLGNVIYGRVKLGFQFPLSYLWVGATFLAFTFALFMSIYWRLFKLSGEETTFYMVTLALGSALPFPISNFTTSPFFFL